MQRSRVGLERLMHERNLDPHGLEATVSDTQGCVLSGALHEAVDLSENTHPITEPGTGVMFNGDHHLLALVVGGPGVAQSFDIHYLHWGFDSTHCVRRQEYRYKTWMSGRARHAEWSAECHRFWPA